MTQANFCRAAVAGFIATFVMSMTGIWQSGLGLPKIDVGAMLSGGIGQGYVWGNFAHYMDGIILGLIYARWFYGILPGPGLMKGLLYGILTMIAAGLIVVPLASAAAGMPAGIFFMQTPMPGAMLLGSLIIHLTYGVTLGIAYCPEKPSPA